MQHICMAMDMKLYHAAKISSKHIMFGANKARVRYTHTSKQYFFRRSTSLCKIINWFICIQMILMHKHSSISTRVKQTIYRFFLHPVFCALSSLILIQNLSLSLSKRKTMQAALRDYVLDFQVNRK